MKKLIAGLMTALMMTLTLVSPVLALSTPCPIPLKIDAAVMGSAAGLHIKLYDNDPLGSLIGEWTTASGGDATLDIGGKADCFDRDDNVIKYKAVIEECKNEPECTRYVGHQLMFYEWDLSEVDLPCPSCPVCDTCPIVDCPSVPNCPPTTIPEDYCDGKCEVKDCSSIENVFAALGAILLLMGGGVKVYLNRAGGITSTHRHRGIRGYHPINNKHRKPYRHRLITEHPFGIGFMLDVKKINEEGGL